MKQVTRQQWINTTGEDSLYDSLKRLLKDSCQYNNVEIENDIVKVDFSVFTIEYYIDRNNQLPSYVLLKNSENSKGNAYEYYAFVYEENKLYINEFQDILSDKIIRFFFKKFKIKTKMLFYNNVTICIDINKPKRKALYQWQKCKNELVRKIKKINENETQEEITNSIKNFIDGEEVIVNKESFKWGSAPEDEVVLEFRALKDLLLQFKQVNELLKDVCVTHIKLTEELNKKADALIKEDRR